MDPYSSLLKDEFLRIDNQYLIYKDLMEFILIREPNMVIHEKSEEEKKGLEKMHKLKKSILRSIADFEKMLTRVSDPEEASLLRSTIATLQLQLRKLELSRDETVPEDKKLQLKLDQVQDEISHISDMLRRNTDPKQIAALKTQRRNLYHVKRTY